MVLPAAAGDRPRASSRGFYGSTLGSSVVLSMSGWVGVCPSWTSCRASARSRGCETSWHRNEWCVSSRTSCSLSYTDADLLNFRRVTCLLDEGALGGGGSSSGRGRRGDQKSPSPTSLLAVSCRGSISVCMFVVSPSSRRCCNDPDSRLVVHSCPPEGVLRFVDIFLSLARRLVTEVLPERLDIDEAIARERCHLGEDGVDAR